jgi:hypothetical protein
MTRHSRHERAFTHIERPGDFVAVQERLTACAMRSIVVTKSWSAVGAVPATESVDPSISHTYSTD